MASTDLLYETFSLYYKKAQECRDRGETEAAKRYFEKAAEQMLKLAKENKGELQRSMFERAKRILQIANELEAPQRKTSNPETESKVRVEKNEKISLEEALAKLEALEGLALVKSKVRDWVSQIKVFKLRRERGIAVPDMSYHLVFTGNPGTGKTTVARIMSQIYCALGIISEGHLVEVDKSDLVAGYVGQTAIKTQEVLKQAIGGVLFIDEAYSLVSGGEFGREAIDTLLKVMEDQRNNLVVIVAGYSDPMESFISSNPGLRSRFKNFINFTDYTGKELYNIFEGLCRKNQYNLHPEAKSILVSYFNALYKKRDKNFGNGRDVRNLFEEVVTRQSNRIALTPNPSNEEMQFIKPEDLPIVAPPPEAAAPAPTPTPEAPKPPKTPEVPKAPEPPKEDEERRPEDAVLEGGQDGGEFKFDWDSLPSINFDDVAGLDDVKETVRVKVLLPLKNPEAFEGYVKKSGGGLLLYGPPGTGKTMIAAAIANEIGAKFCSVKPSDLLHQGAGQSEKAIRALFAQARRFPCSVIYFDEMDSISPKNTKSQYAKQLRSEFLAQLQGIESYGKQNNNILFLIAATNKPWDIDSAFVRPGRFGTRVYVGLPDFEARKYMVDKRLSKIREKGLVRINEDINTADIANSAEGFNCSDITNLLDRIEEISIVRGIETGDKFIGAEDFEKALSEIPSTVQRQDIEKLMEWSAENN